MGNFSTESDLVKGCFGNRGSVDGDRRHVALKYLFYYVSVAIVTNCPGAEHGLWAWVGLMIEVFRLTTLTFSGYIFESFYLIAQRRPWLFSYALENVHCEM